MTLQLNHTHDAARSSWLGSANAAGADFPIQNLPFAVFRRTGRDIGYCHLEKLHNLEALPASGFTISCFPHKVRGASAGWTRAVAIVDERLFAAVAG